MLNWLASGRKNESRKEKHQTIKKEKITNRYGIKAARICENKKRMSNLWQQTSWKWRERSEIKRSFKLQMLPLLYKQSEQVCKKQKQECFISSNWINLVNSQEAKVQKVLLSNQWKTSEKPMPLFIKCVHREKDSDIISQLFLRKVWAVKQRRTHRPCYEILTQRFADTCWSD